MLRPRNRYPKASNGGVAPADRPVVGLGLLHHRDQVRQRDGERFLPAQGPSMGSRLGWGSSWMTAGAVPQS